MPQRPQRAKSSKTLRGRKRAKPGKSGSGASRLLQQVCDGLPRDQEAFIRSIHRERMKLTKELKKLRSERNDTRSAVPSSGENGPPVPNAMESFRVLASDVLKLLNRGSGTMLELIREVLRLIAETAGFEAVGLRLHQGNDFPYYEQKGFSDDFVYRENFLCVNNERGGVVLDSGGKPLLECTCGLVLGGKADPTKPFFTEGGSFWTNSASDLMKLAPNEDPRTNPRNTCIHSGYQSVALIPVHSGDEIMGLLQLNDKRKDRLTPETVRMLEGLGDQIGLAIQRKKAEEALKVLNESLERRVQERSLVAEHRAAQLQKLTMELTIAEQRERQKLATVLHDGLQQILVGSKIQLGFVERSQNIHESVEQAKELIDDAIEISRSLTAELSPPILLQGDLNLACEWLAGWMRRKYGLKVRFVAGKKIQPTAEEIKLLIFQALRELLFNVVKHAGVDEAVFRLKEKEGWIEAVIEDKGKGFDPGEIRAGGGRSEGMGLFGIRERLTYFGGRMEIDSSPGKGSRFRMILPNSILSARNQESSRLRILEIPDTHFRDGSLHDDPSRKIRVLLVDDHKVVRQGLARLLQKEVDMEIVGEAVDGESAVESVRSLLPDVVLMDINMPGISGIEAAGIIHRELPDIRIIGLSMYQEDEQAAAMKKAGASGYLSKNGSLESVLDAIRSSMGRNPKTGA